MGAGDEFKACALETRHGSAPPSKKNKSKPSTIGVPMNDSDLCQGDLIEAVNRGRRRRRRRNLTECAAAPLPISRSPEGGLPKSGSARRYKPSNAGSARQGSRGAVAPRASRGSREAAITSPLSRVLAGQMSDDLSRPTRCRACIPQGAVSRELPIVNKRGCPARSAKFVQMVERFDDEVGGD